MYLSTVRPGLLDVRSLVVRAVVVLVAAIGYMSLFVALESLLEVLGEETPPVGLLAVLGAISALAFHPLEVALRGVVDALLFGVRPDPLGAAAQMADQIGEDPEQALRAIRAALVLPYAAIELDGRVVAASGDRVTYTREVALSLGTDDAGRPVGGTLVVGLRPGDLSLGDDETVLRLVGQILAQTLRARALAADLRESRGQVVDALEEERRRLRRDLHDGLGPRLSGIAFTADAARNSLRADPALAEQLLTDLRAETATAIADIRQLVYGMRPPALDELGLVGALQQQSRALRAVDGSPVAVEFRAAELPELGAAVEVAAYRIVVEALTNVARHSSAHTASVRIEPGDGALRVEVLDDGGRAGANGRSAWTAGVGISAMRERAAEVGGDLTAEPGETGGRVLATLPIRSAAR
jgi:signal transduction histidine kinase